jgi:hypothetical protein
MALFSTAQGGSKKHCSSFSLDVSRLRAPYATCAGFFGFKTMRP